jgi:hypothetical protein
LDAELPQAPDLALVRQDQRRAAIDRLFEEPWTLLYRFRGEEAWFSAMLDSKAAPRALKKLGWDLHFEDIGPSMVTQGSGQMPLYQRFARAGVEPLVLVRHPNGGPPLIEMAEDFRLFLNLFPDGDGNLYRTTPGGDRETVVKISADEVKASKASILRYLQARRMHLAVFFDHISHFTEVAANPLPDHEHGLDVVLDDRVWSFVANDDTGELLSRIMGKRLLAPPSRTERLDSEAEQRHVDFIIGYDELGRPREHTADPRRLSDFFGKNRGAPNYLTPVHFRGDVLDRYFHNPGRYAVTDGLVRQGHQWLLKMDNDHSDRVIVFLGDLGRDLPYTEQLHWRAHNVVPDGGLSATAIARSFDALPADGEQLDHRFKAAYERLAEAWTERHGWALFRPLTAADQHLLTKLHVPSSDNPAELDAQILGLAKILVDSLNDPALDAALASPVADERSLAKLERLLRKLGYRETDRDLVVLRSIQGLRSSGVAHTRGSTYEKSLKRLGLIGQPAPVVVSRLLAGAVLMLETLLEDASQPRPGV